MKKSWISLFVAAILLLSTVSARAQREGRKFVVRCGRSYESAAHARQGNWVGVRPATDRGAPLVKVADRTPVELTFPLQGVPPAFSYVIRVEYRGWLFLYGDEHELSPTVDDPELRPFTLRFTGVNPVGAAGLASLGLLAVVSTALLHRRARKMQLEHQLTSAALEQVKAGSGGLMLSTIGGYRVVHKLGEGGQAVVYRGLPADTMNADEQVAIKLIKDEYSRRDDFRQRFLREVKACCRLSHPSILRIIDWGEEDGQLYMVTELVEGSTLQHVLRPGGLPVNRAVKYLGAILEAVGHAHQRGIVHRDLKPSNVMVTKQDGIKIMDFGLAGGQDLAQITVTGQVFGTLAYVAPERIDDGRCLDPRSDLYSIGIMAYELFTGRLPFDAARGPGGLLAQHLASAFPSMRTLRPDLPAALSAVVKRMVARTPSERFGSAEEAIAALSAAHREASEFVASREDTEDLGPQVQS